MIMTPVNDEIIAALKSAREAKGLSQRELSARTGVPQSHISKIEQGNADIRLSSLIELARALELELKLVPRKALPAVESILRMTAGSAPVGTENKAALRDLRRSLDTISRLRDAFPDLGALRALQESLQVASNLDDLTGYRDALRGITMPIRDIQKRTRQARQVRDAAGLSGETLRQLEEAAKAARHLRNHLVQRPHGAGSASRPAYRLDDDEEETGDG